MRYSFDGQSAMPTVVDYIALGHVIFQHKELIRGEGHLHHPGLSLAELRRDGVFQTQTLRDSRERPAP